MHLEQLKLEVLKGREAKSFLNSPIFEAAILEVARDFENQLQHCDPADLEKVQRITLCKQLLYKVVASIEHAAEFGEAMEIAVNTPKPSQFKRDK